MTRHSQNHQKIKKVHKKCQIKLETLKISKSSPKTLLDVVWIFPVSKSPTSVAHSYILEIHKEAASIHSSQGLILSCSEQYISSKNIIVVQTGKFPVKFAVADQNIEVQDQS